MDVVVLEADHDLVADLRHHQQAAGLPAFGAAIRAHELSVSSPERRVLHAHAPELLGVVVVRHVPITTELPQPRLPFGVIRSTRLREERPAVEKFVL